MVREICKDTMLLGRKAVPAGPGDEQTGTDLLDTLQEQSAAFDDIVLVKVIDRTAFGGSPCPVIFLVFSLTTDKNSLLTGYKQSHPSGHNKRTGFPILISYVAKIFILLLQGPFHTSI